MTFTINGRFEAESDDLPDECLFAVIGLRSAVVGPSDQLPNGAIVVGGIQVQVNCPLELVVRALEAVRDEMVKDLAADVARMN